MKPRDDLFWEITAREVYKEAVDIDSDTEASIDNIVAVLKDAFPDEPAVFRVRDISSEEIYLAQRVEGGNFDLWAWCDGWNVTKEFLSDRFTRLDGSETA